MQQNAVQTAWARDLRQNPTAAESLLWNALRDRRMMGWKFRRQAPLGPWIVAFLCLKQTLVVEIGAVSNPARGNWLTVRGYRRVVLDDHDVLTDLSWCLLQLCAGVTTLHEVRHS